MKFVALIYRPQGALDDISREEMNELHLGHEKLQDASRGDGIFVLFNRLHHPDLAAIISQNEGQYQVTDGPFTKIQEVLWGYYLFECDNLEHAIRYAKRIPMTEGSKIEVRPVASYMD
ncbi:hypothetical protein AB835_06915 [Candidatus Endobugula sertula]|uniref:YCII-related domain-containing protein n=1 Tax=Candidatus Endobugula sertula TaxID=62101 RepID=A0A1D2QQC4_9GAMM|nr:hypothetical protein AB835_06915 [Candidatus Endobugula sertula]